MQADVSAEEVMEEAEEVMEVVEVVEVVVEVEGKKRPSCLTRAGEGAS